MYRLKTLFSSLSLIFLLVTPFLVLAEESITITTYYPSPYGSYNDLYVANRLGIGTTGPEATLDIPVNLSTPALRLGPGGDSGRIWTEYKNTGPAIIMYDLDDIGGGIYFRESPTTNSETTPEYEAFIVGRRGNVGIGTTNPGGGTGSSVLSLANSSAAPTALASVTHLYSSANEGYWMDAAGNATLQTPHDKVTGEWIFYSKNIKTGRVVRVDMERLVKAVEKVTGEKFMVETREAVN